MRGKTASAVGVPHGIHFLPARVAPYPRRFQMIFLSGQPNLLGNSSFFIPFEVPSGVGVARLRCPRTRTFKWPIDVKISPRGAGSAEGWRPQVYSAT